MRIQITFSEAAKYLPEPLDANLEKVGEELESHIADAYFNGADLAIRFMGYSTDDEVFYFEMYSN